MAKRNLKKGNSSALKPAIIAGGAAFIIILAILFIIEYQKKKKLLAQTQAENKNLKNKLTHSHTNVNYWMNMYLSQLSWLEQYQHIPNPDQVVRGFIEKLQGLKSSIFAGQPEFCKETDEALHALKGERLTTSFFSLAKMIENLLKHNLLTVDDFKDQFKKKLEKGTESINFNDCISFIKQNNLFDPDTIIFLNDVRETRNCCAHEISPDIDKNILIGLHDKCIETIETIVFSIWHST